MVLPRLSVLKVVSRTTLPMLFRHHFQRRSTIYKIKMDSAVRNMKLYLFCKGHYYFFAILICSSLYSLEILR